MIDPGSDGSSGRGQCWANGRVADQMWRGVGVFMFPSSLSSPVWSVTSGRGCVGWQLKRCDFLKNTNIILGSWIITRAMAMQQKCHVLPEITRNARRKWLLENMWGKIGNRTRLNIIFGNCGINIRELFIFYQNGHMTWQKYLYSCSSEYFLSTDISVYASEFMKIFLFT